MGGRYCPYCFFQEERQTRAVQYGGAMPDASGHFNDGLSDTLSPVAPKMRQLAEAALDDAPYEEEMSAALTVRHRPMPASKGGNVKIPLVFLESCPVA